MKFQSKQLPRFRKQWLAAIPVLLVAGWLIMLNRFSPPPRPAEAVLNPQDSSRVFAADDRTPVTTSDLLPYSAIGEIRAWWGTKGYSGTGCLVSENTVLTAAHCVYRTELGGWADVVVFSPSRNGSLEPYGSATAVRMTVPANYTIQKRQADDIALITLSTTIGNQTGWVRLAGDDTQVEQLSVLSAGYPSDKPGHQMYSVAGNTSTLHNGLIYTDIDAIFGQSGSPIWKLDTDGQPTIVAVLVAELDNGVANLGVPVTLSVVERLASETQTASSTDALSTASVDNTQGTAIMSPIGACGMGVLPMLVCSIAAVAGWRRGIRYS